ncbi:MAG: DinB family protein [Planctomycetota bacterium]|jgi:hypothetical protein
MTTVDERLELRDQILGHLMDVEWVFGFRTRTMVCDERPTLSGIDQDLWTAAQEHNERDPRDLLESFRTLRELNLRFWRSLSPEQRQSVGVHAERGEERVETMLHMLAGHDLVHLDQLVRYIAAIDAG